MAIPMGAAYLARESAHHWWLKFFTRM